MEQYYFLFIDHVLNLESSLYVCSLDVCKKLNCYIFLHLLQGKHSHTSQRHSTPHRGLEQS